MDKSIPATTNDRLRHYRTTETDCRCEGFRKKTELYLCPWTMDRICSHMYRFRLFTRHRRILALFTDTIIPHLISLYGEAFRENLEKTFYPAELERIEVELCRPVPPTLLNRRAKKSPAEPPAASGQRAG